MASNLTLAFGVMITLSPRGTGDGKGGARGGAVSFLPGGAPCAPVPARSDGHNRAARSIPRREGELLRCYILEILTFFLLIKGRYSGTPTRDT